jgi:hypothetical protein
MYPNRGSHHPQYLSSGCIFHVHEARAGSYALAMYPASFGAITLQCQSVCPFLMESVV